MQVVNNSLSYTPLFKFTVIIVCDNMVDSSEGRSESQENILFLQSQNFHFKTTGKLDNSFFHDIEIETPSFLTKIPFLLCIIVTENF